MKSEDLLRQALAIEAPWQIVRVRDDLARRQVDVWVAPAAARGGWFFNARPQVDGRREQVWRHINLGHSRCLVHAEPPADSGELPAWCGDDELPFSRAMTRQIADMLREGVKLQSVCALLDIAIGDLWKFKHSLDNGRIGLSAGEAAASRVPDAEDAVWQRLLDGSAQLDIRVLSLKLLLAKLREQMRVISDPEVRQLKAYELQRYFVRYEATLGHELAQLADL